jgi:hypothetical protein
MRDNHVAEKQEFEKEQMATMQERHLLAEAVRETLRLFADDFSKAGIPSDGYVSFREFYQTLRQRESFPFLESDVRQALGIIVIGEDVYIEA